MKIPLKSSNELFSASNVEEDVIRETNSSETVCAFTVSCTNAVWCTLKRSIFIWNIKWKDPVLVAFSDFVVKSIYLTLGHDLFLADEDHIAVYSFVYQNDSDGSDAILLRRLGYAYHFGRVLHMSASSGGEMVAMSTENYLILVDCKTPFPQKDFLADDDCPVILVNCTEWFRHRGSAMTCFLSSDRILVLSSDNQLVAVRPVGESHTVQLVRDGHVLTRAHNVTCIAASSVEDALIVVGLSDGTVKLLQMDTLEVFRTLDLVVLLENLVVKLSRAAAGSSNRPWKACKGAGGLHRRSAVKDSFSVPPLMAPFPSNVTSEILDPIICDVAIGYDYIVASTPDAVLYLNKNTFALENEMVHFFDDDVAAGVLSKLNLSHAGVENEEIEKPISQCASNGCWLTLNPLTGDIKHFVAAPSPSFVSHTDSHENNEEDLLRSYKDLPTCWLTRLLPSGSGMMAVQQVARSSAVENKPVTFGHPIKSAGYNEAPWSEQQKLKKKSSLIHGGTFAFSSIPTVVPKEPYGAHKFIPMNSANRMLASSGNVHRSAVTAAIFASSGETLLTASSDSSLIGLKFPVVKNHGLGIGLKGHTAAVLSVDTNLSQKTTLLLSAGADATVCVWKPGIRETPYVNHKVPMCSEVRAARFLYTDKFIAYTTKNKIEVCKFVLDNGGGDLNRKRNESCLSKPLSSLTTDAQHFTAMDTISHMPTTILVAGTSNKSLTVFDVVSEKPLRVVCDAHRRTIHKVVMCAKNRWVSNLSASAEHLFLTSGLDSAVNLWDLRQQKSIRQFALHKNSALTTLGLSFSSSGSFFAVGSEDRSVYLYDVRSGGPPLDIISCSDIPTALAFHVTEPILAIGTSLGSVQFYGQK